MKISSFIIGLVLVSIFVGVMGVAMSQLGTEYSRDYDNTTLSSYNKMEELAGTSEELRNKTLSSGVDSSLTDVLGGFFQEAYIALKMSFSSYSLFESMSNEAFDEGNLGYAAIFFRIGIPIIVLISLVFVIVKAITKVDV